MGGDNAYLTTGNITTHLPPKNLDLEIWLSGGQIQFRKLNERTGGIFKWPFPPLSLGYLYYLLTQCANFKHIVLSHVSLSYFVFPHFLLIGDRGV